MGAGHSHFVGHAGGRHRWRLAAAFVMIFAFFGVELAYGLLTGSLALLSDAGHMVADVVALGAALVATVVATRPDHSGRRTFGFYRAEVFASGLAVLLMLAAAAYVVVAAVGRIGEPVEVDTGPMLVVGALGLVVNLVAMVLLRGGASESLNVKGAYLEVVADSVNSVGVLVAGWLVWRTGDSYWDTVVALAIGGYISVRAVVLGREVLAVLGQGAPADVEVDRLLADLAALDGVEEVHDLHLWTLTSGMNVATAHLVTLDAAGQQAVLSRARTVLRAARHRAQHPAARDQPGAERRGTGLVSQDRASHSIDTWNVVSSA